MKTKLIHKTLAVSLIFSMVSPIGTPLSTKTVLANAGGVDGIISTLDKDGKRYPAKTFGGSADDKIMAIEKTLDGGYIISGSSFSNNGDIGKNSGDRDGFIVKLDSQMNVVWKKVVGGTRAESFTDVHATKDGGYVVTGYTNSKDGDFPGGNSWDSIVVKFDKDGNIQWKSRFGGYRDDSANKIAETADGKFVISGYSDATDGTFLNKNKGNYDAFLVMVDKTGNVLWSQTLGGTKLDSFYGLTITNDGNIIAVGNTQSTDKDLQGLTQGSVVNAIIAKYDMSGNLLWVHDSGGVSDDTYYEVRQTPDGGYITSGWEKPTTNYDATLSKFDENGIHQWTKGFGGSSTEIFMALDITSQDEYVLGGYTYSTDGIASGNKGGTDTFIVKTNNKGEMLWSKVMGGTGNDFFNDVVIGENDKIIPVGDSISTSGDFEVDKLPPSEASNLNGGKEVNSVTITWQPPTNDDFDFVNIYRDNEFIKKVSNAENSYTDVSLLENTLYTYKLVTGDTSGNTSVGTELQARTLDKTPPSPVSHLNETHTDKEVTLTWLNPEDEDFKSVHVYRNGTLVYSSESGTSFTDTELEDGVMYTYKITTIDNNLNESVGTPIQAKTTDVTPPSAVSRLKETHTDKEVTLTWENPLDTDFKSVNIYRDGKLVYTGSSTSFTDSGLKDSVNYTYSITTRDNDSNESRATQIQVKTTDVTPPSNISQLEETHTDKQITLTWKNPLDTDFKSVNIYRDGKLIYTGTTTSFTDKQLLERTIYDYKLVTIDNDNNRSEGVKIQITTNDEFAPTKPIESPKNVNKEITYDVKKEDIIENDKTLIKHTISAQSITAALENNYQVENVALKLSPNVEKQVVVIPSDVIQTLKDVKTNIKLVTEDNKELTIKLQTVPDINTLKNIKVEIQKPEQDVLKAEQNKGVITGENLGKLSIQMIDESNQAIKSQKDKITVSIKLPESLRNKEIETNIYKKNPEDNSYIMIHSKTDNKVKTFTVDNGEANYSIGIYDKTFKDVPKENWATQTINFMVSKNFVSGTSEDTFEPNKQVTRAEFVSMLVRAAGYDKASTTNSKFSDVPKDSWYYNDLLIAEENDLIKGISATTFGPDKTLTREESVSILLRVMEKEGLKFPITDSEVTKIPTKFQDSKSISKWARSDMAKAIKYKLTNGLSEKSINAAGSANRAQAVVFVKKTLDKLEWY